MAANSTEPAEDAVLTLSNGLRILKLDFSEDMNVDVLTIEQAPATRSRRRFQECGCYPMRGSVGRG